MRQIFKRSNKAAIKQTAKIVCTIGATLGLASLAPTAFAEGWSKSYVVEWYEPAFYYGAGSGTTLPGTDCENGTLPELDRRQVLKTPYRTWEEIDVILDPENSQWNRVAAIRGPNKENVYKEPWAANDPGMPGVTGNLSYGFDLDGDPTNGFKTPDGQSGIDNNYYRVAGCWMGWRGPERASHHAAYVNDGMRDGVYSVVMVLSGEGQDPENDPDAKLGIYLSFDKMVKDANGDIAPDYTFRINTDPRFQTVVPVSVSEGRIQSKSQSRIDLRDIETAPFFPPELILHGATLQFYPSDKYHPEGLTGYMGGYRPVKDYYTGWAAAGSIHEAVLHMNMVGYWYALQRGADYKTDPSLEKPDAISTAYRFFMTPAFVATPDGTERVTKAVEFKGEIDESLSITSGMRRRRPAPPAE